MALSRSGVVTVELPQQLFETSSGPFALTTFRGRAASQFKPSAPQYGPLREDLWTFTIEAAPMGRAATVYMEAWFHRLARRDWAFTAWDPLRQLPLGRGNDYSPANSEILFTDDAEADQSFCSDYRLLAGSTRALVRTAAARGATTILAKGFDTSLAGQTLLKFGDHLSIGLPGEMNLHMSAASAVCDANGEARIELANPLWKRSLVNDVIEFARPTGRFGLYAMDDNGSVELVRSAGPLSRGSLRAIEFPYQEGNI